MSLQFADIDADGHEDIITATFEGAAFVVRGSAEGWQAPEYIQDDLERNIVLSFFYDMEANEYANAERSPGGCADVSDTCLGARARGGRGIDFTATDCRPAASGGAGSSPVIPAAENGCACA